MAAKKATSWSDKIRAAFKSRDEGELESVLEDLPDNAELHLHIAPTAEATPAAETVVTPVDNAALPSGPSGVGFDAKKAFDSITKDMKGLRDRAVGHDRESDEMWDAIGRLADAARRARDGEEDDDKTDDTKSLGAFDAPQRDARRARMKDEGKDDDKDDKKETKDEFRDPPGPPGLNETKELAGVWGIEAAPGTALDSLKRVRDSGWMQDGFQETVAFAEILVPGIRLPTFDSARPKETTAKLLCSFRSRTLELAWNQPETRDLIEDASGRRFTGSARGMPCAQVRDLFVAVGAMKRRENNSARRPHALEGDNFQPMAGTVQSLADLQKLHGEHWVSKRH